MPDWTTAYEEHGPTVLAYLTRRLHRREDAEDLAQETFTRVLASPTALRDEGKIRSYLLSTAHNVLVNFRRRRTLVLHESDDESVAHQFEAARDERATTESRVRLRELAEDLQRALDELPADQREAFRWGVIEKLPYREVAERMGWSVSKVKICVFRARKSVLGKLDAHVREDRYHDEPDSL